MKKPDVNKNMQLIRCWNDIQQWISDNCKEIVIILYPSARTLLAIENGKVQLTRTQGDFTLRGKSCFYNNNSRKSLTSIVRTQEQPFIEIEVVVSKWDTLKAKLIAEKERIEKIYNFKA